MDSKKRTPTTIRKEMKVNGRISQRGSSFYGQCAREGERMLRARRFVRRWSDGVDQADQVLGSTSEIQIEN